MKGKVFTTAWESDAFRFLRGVFQGDPFSGINFLTIFTPIIEYIKQFKQTHGYEVTLKDNETPAKFVITTSFADNFNIITNNKDTDNHQELITQVEEKIKFMGLVLKPRKSRSLSIVQEKAIKQEF